jgi:hypothetical protein
MAEGALRCRYSRPQSEVHSRRPQAQCASAKRVPGGELMRALDDIIDAINRGDAEH